MTMYSLKRLRPHRLVLLIVALVGLVGINGVFLYSALIEPPALADALGNPISLAFIVEAFVMVGFAAFIIRSARLERPGWLAFVVMSLVGGLAFSVPAFLLLHMRRDSAESLNTGASSTIS